MVRSSFNLRMYHMKKPKYKSRNITADTICASENALIASVGLLITKYTKMAVRLTMYIVSKITCKLNKAS